ncbi:MAG: hypothetical protein MI922_05760 [Bacteroidales bacterium]|nr:hypothetical protein [Bacteroidales bacterium]
MYNYTYDKLGLLKNALTIDNLQYLISNHEIIMEFDFAKNSEEAEQKRKESWESLTPYQRW